MISALNNFCNHKYQPKIYKQVNFCSNELEMKPPRNFDTVRVDFLHKGGVIDTAEEFNYTIWEKGVKTILSFLDPCNKDESIMLQNERKLINQHNQKYPDHHINFNSLPCWWSSLRYSHNRPELKTKFIEKINSLPKPIYMHCLAGRDLSQEMVELFQEAAKEGKINLKI